MSEENNPRTKYNLPTFNSIVQEIGYDLESYTVPSIETARHVTLNGDNNLSCIKFNKGYFYQNGTYQYKTESGTFPKYLWPKILKLAEMLIENTEVENVLYE